MSDPEKANTSKAVSSEDVSDGNTHTGFGRCQYREDVRVAEGRKPVIEPNS
jgi:hypothetical protein